MVFPVIMYGCENWTIKKAEHQRMDAFELWCWRRLLCSSKEIKPVNPKGNQSWLFIGRTDAETEVAIFWPPDAKNWLTGITDLLEKTLMLGKIEGTRRRGATEDKMVGWHHRLSGHEFEQGPGTGDGQGSLTCCSPWCHKESDTTERLNWTEFSSDLSSSSSFHFYYLKTL